MTSPGLDPSIFVSIVESGASRQHTRHGACSMVWRIWGEGRPVVLLHGASGSWTHWIRNVLPLAARFRVFVPDLPGFGDSETPPEPHTADSLADALVSGLDVLAPSPGQFDLAGFSLGGIIGGLVAARLGPRVRSLVLLGPGGMALPHPPLPPLLRIGSDRVSAHEVRRAHRENLRRLMIADPEKVDDLAVFVQTENLRRARFKSGSIPTSDALLRALPSITARIAGIWGALDVFAGPHVEERQRLLASFERDLDFRVIDGAGHWVTYEAADEVNAALHDIFR